VTVVTFAIALIAFAIAPIRARIAARALKTPRSPR